MKAIYKGKYKDKYSYAVHLIYEYKGFEYIVTDEHNGYSQPMWEKHKEEQARIDQMIKKKEKKDQSGILPGTWDDSIMANLFEIWEG